MKAENPKSTLRMLARVRPVVVLTRPLIAGLICVLPFNVSSVLAEVGRWDERFGVTNTLAGTLVPYRGEVYSTTYKWDGTTATKWPSNAVNLITGPASLGVEGGLLHAVGSVPGGVVTWDGEQWRAFDPPGPGKWNHFGEPQVRAVVPFKGRVVVGGFFTYLQGKFVNGLVAHSQSTWSEVGVGFSSVEEGHAQVQCLLVVGDSLYVGGQWETAAGRFATVAKWDGTNWTVLAGTGNVYTLAWMAGELYAGGRFDSINGVAAENIARFDGTNWLALDKGLSASPNDSPFVSSMAVSGHKVYAAGRFTHAGNTLVNNIAVWDGNSWSSLGEGLTSTNTPTASSVLVWNNDLLVTGSFTHAGGIPSLGFAIWHPDDPPKLSIQRTGAGVRLDWPSGATNYVLESVADLGVEAWRAEPLSVPGTNVFETSPSGAARYFRLRKQP